MLAREGVRATFFVLGRQVDRHPELVRRMVAEGHQVANHGYDHGILIFRGARHVRDQLRRTEAAVARAAGPRGHVAALPRAARLPRPGDRGSGRAGPATGWPPGRPASSIRPSRARP